MTTVFAVSLLSLRLVRLAKFAAVMMFVAGAVGAIVPGALERRRVFAYRIAGPGFGLTWAFGFLLTFLSQQSFLQSWLLGSLVLSLLTLHGVLYAVGAEGRPGRGGVALVLGSLLATLALMVLRP